jgi:methylated-DNA-[protein]-cysteine S-methyltransferase
MDMKYYEKYESPLGTITFAGIGDTLTGLWFDGQKYFGADQLKECRKKELPIFGIVRKWLDIYFCGKDPGFMPAIFMDTTPFRREVWEVLLKIPYGETMTYGEIAHVIAKQKGIKTMSAQAVGGAVGHNAISLIIPCHRVIGKNGSLIGYAGGVNRKAELLKLENAKKMQGVTIDHI